MPLNSSPQSNAPSIFSNLAVDHDIPLSVECELLLGSNPSRKKLIIANNSNQDLCIDLKGIVSLDSYAVKIPAVTPEGFVSSYELSEYTGVVTGIWTGAGTGVAMVREMVDQPESVQGA